MFRLLYILVFLILPHVVRSQDSSLFATCFHRDSIRNIVEVLASDSLQGRFTGKTGNTKAALFIAEEFRKAGLLPVSGFNGYFMDAGGYGSNILGAIKGTKTSGQVIIFSAHFDHVGTDATNPFPGLNNSAPGEKGDHIFNGANDNASGVAAIISLAKYFAKAPRPEKTILFMAFNGEELGLKGSAHAATLFDPDSIIANINIEMIGRPHFSNCRPYMTGADYSRLISIMNERLYEYDPARYKKSFIRPDPFTQQDLYMRSDNYSFAKKGVIAHSIMVTSPEDKYYHSKNDEPDTLDYDLMSEIIKAIAIGSTGLVNGEDILSRKKKKK